ncbi:hypothetical protein JIR23_05645 [Bradyrhizobium diazoefficiens]|nr:hypothetical protein [Bradyrhizobium diazoefficiens]QQN65281.1 hypothetical protein JIR23_05645 [Bradyrhizobium diazoefficiens]
MQQPSAQKPGLILLCRDTERLQRTIQILWKGFALRPGLRARGGNVSAAGPDYFFFFELFFATFLVAAFVVFFAFFAFLAMSSSVKKQTQ